MDESNQTQKEVGKKYRDNLRYFRTVPVMARERFYLCMLVLLLGVWGIIRLQGRDQDVIYNPAPLSLSHARYEQDCAVCHNPAARNIFQPAAIAGARGSMTGSNASMPVHSWGRMKPAAFTSSLMINQACLTCHANMDLHQPTAETVALEGFHSELHVVVLSGTAYGSGCFSCHQEHLGRIAMKLPGDSACAACHDDATRMAESFMLIPLHRKPSEVAFTGTTSDGLIHFIPPERQAPLPLFTSFERGHPAFEYEQPGLKDPFGDTLIFSHAEHLHLKTGQQLSCEDCHKPSPGGIYYDRITYKVACQRCHSIQFDIKNPELTVPHGSVPVLGAYLNSLPFQYRKLYDLKYAPPGVTPKLEDENKFADEQIRALLDRAGISLPVGQPVSPARIFGQLEHQILFTSDPYLSGSPVDGRSYFSGCAYCHQVTEGAQPGMDAVVTPPLMVDRWLAHGRFTHAAHVGLKQLERPGDEQGCTYCHSKAASSNVSSDMLMPSQASCVMCHKAQGSAPSDCLTCHTFHSPMTVAKTVKAQMNQVGIPTASTCPAIGQMSSFLVSDRHTTH